MFGRCCFFFGGGQVAERLKHVSCENCCFSSPTLCAVRCRTCRSTALLLQCGRNTAYLVIFLLFCRQIPSFLAASVGLVDWCAYQVVPRNFHFFHNPEFYRNGGAGLCFSADCLCFGISLFEPEPETRFLLSWSDSKLPSWHRTPLPPLFPPPDSLCTSKT